MKISSDTLVVMADGQKAVFLRNESQDPQMKLERLCVMTLAAEPSRKLGRDRPGHAQIRSESLKTSYRQPDYHQLLENRFLGSVANGIQQFFKIGDFNDIVLIAEPRALGVLRQKIDENLRPSIRAEISRDYLKTNLPDLEHYLLNSFK